MKIGILGGGQLARMLSLAAHPLGLRTICIDPLPNVCASPVTKVITADYLEEAFITEFADLVDCVTFENENIPVETATLIERYCPVYPSINALKTTQDRLHEKELFHRLNIATPRYTAVNSLDELTRAASEITLPAILKTRRFGYDGKGQYLIKTNRDINKAWKAIGGENLILEQYIAFEREVSIISVRGKNGETKHYPLVENTHQNGILRVSKAPFEHATLEKMARNYAEKILDEFDYVGTLAIEFFQKEQMLIANEIAPRVHNTGHWTIEGSITSQFENHIRAISGLPLGNTQSRGFSLMFNCIGTEPNRENVLSINGCHYHSYDKQAREMRKLGHVTLNCEDLGLFQDGVDKLTQVMNSD